MSSAVPPPTPVCPAESRPPLVFSGNSPPGENRPLWNSRAASPFGRDLQALERDREHRGVGVVDLAEVGVLRAPARGLVGLLGGLDPAEHAEVGVLAGRVVRDAAAGAADAHPGVLLLGAPRSRSSSRRRRRRRRATGTRRRGSGRRSSWSRGSSRPSAPSRSTWRSGSGCAQSRSATQIAAISSAEEPDCVHVALGDQRRRSALNCRPVGASHSRGMPLTESMSIIACRSAEPQRSE